MSVLHKSPIKCFSKNKKKHKQAHCANGLSNTETVNLKKSYIGNDLSCYFVSYTYNKTNRKKCNRKTWLPLN